MKSDKESEDEFTARVDEAIDRWSRMDENDEEEEDNEDRDMN